MSKSFDKLLASVNKRYGKATVVRATDSTQLTRCHRIPTGIFSMDIALGGGVPTGRIIILKGEFSSGKSLVALKTVAAFQRHCRNCGDPRFAWDELTQEGEAIDCCGDPEPMRVVWFDAENCWQNPWAERFGVDTEALYVMRTEFAEQGIDVADALIRSGQCDLLVVDSVAQMTPSVEIEASTEKWQMGLHARLMNKAMRKWMSAQSQGSLARPITCTVLLLNQIRMKVGVIYGSPETSPGGKGMDFAASIVGKVKKTGLVESNQGLAIGHQMEVTFVKNKTAIPMRGSSFDLLFKKRGRRAQGSSSYAKEVLNVAKYWKLVQVSGSWFTLAKGVRIQGLDAAGRWLETEAGAATLAMLRDQVWKREVSWLDGTAEEELNASDTDEEDDE